MENGFFVNMESINIFLTSIVQTSSLPLKSMGIRILYRVQKKKTKPGNYILKLLEFIFCDLQIPMYVKILMKSVRLFFYS